MEDCIKQKRHVHIYLQDYSFHNLLAKDKKNLAKNAESQQIYYLLIHLENIFFTLTILQSFHIIIKKLTRFQSLWCHLTLSVLFIFVPSVHIL